MNKKRLINNILVPVVAFGIILVAWAVVAYCVGSKYIMPTISSTIEEFVQLLSQDDFYSAIIGTTWRSIVAFILSSVLALLLMLVCEVSAFAKRVVLVIVAVVRSVPTMSVILILIIWTSSDMTPIIVASLIIFPTIFSSMTAAREGIDKSLEENTRLCDISRAEKFIKVYVPLCAPVTLEGMANAISLGVKIVIASELLAQTSDALGRLMQISRVNFAMAQLFAYTLVAIAISILLEYIIRLIKKLLFSY